MSTIARQTPLLYRARYLEKLKLLGLNESGDPCDMENGSNLGENMTCWPGHIIC